MTNFFTSLFGKKPKTRPYAVPSFAPSDSRSFFTPDQEKECQKNRLDNFRNELYNLEAEQAFSIRLIFNLRQDLEIHKNRLAELERELPQGEDKLEKSARHEYTRISQEMAGVDFQLRKAADKLKKLYEQVAMKSDTVRALRKNIRSTEDLVLSEVPQLPFFEINGTRYAARNNEPLKNAEGVMELFIEHGQTNAA